jgi:UDP-N-acetylmuramyl pentapeptide synthase
MDLKISEILEATNGLLLTANCKKTIKEISTDSRKISDNCLFIPLKGDNYDGHDYIQSALESGAAATLVEKGAGIESILKQKHPEKTLVEVDCTLKRWVTSQTSGGVNSKRQSSP